MLKQTRMLWARGQLIQKTRSFYGKWRFYGSEISLTVTEPTDVKIEFIAKDGTTTVLKKVHL
jgi:monomeric isocitrate dehydrogenase